MMVFISVFSLQLFSAVHVMNLTFLDIDINNGIVFRYIMSMYSVMSQYLNIIYFGRLAMFERIPFSCLQVVSPFINPKLRPKILFDIDCIFTTDSKSFKEIVVYST